MRSATWRSSSIYGNITVVKDRYYVSYNNTIAHEKGKIHLFDGAAGTIEKNSDADFCVDIIDEHDYVCMLDRIHFEHPLNSISSRKTQA